MNLIRNGFPNRILYTQFLPKFVGQFSEHIKTNQRKFCEYLMLAIGYNTIDFKLGEKAVFFRQGKGSEVEQLEKLEFASMKDVMDKIKYQYKQDEEKSQAQSDNPVCKL